ncbi:MAG: CBS domain-containing protein [Oleiphilaceae bacterium]|nr:CBS domain-containing protein [Oleiphilaceae bacterium]
MNIHVAEPGRPQGTRLPERFRTRRVAERGEPEAIPRTASNQERPVDPTRFPEQNPARARQALAEYQEEAGQGQSSAERPYLPAERLASSDLVTLSADQDLRAGLARMDERSIHHLVIVSEGQVAGLVDRQWVLWHLWRDGGEQSFALRELPAFITVSADTDAHELARQMLGHDLMAAVVMDPMNRPTGVVTSTDYLRLYAEARQLHTEI